MTESLMNRDQLEKRIQAELALPFWRAKMAQNTFTELEYQTLKTQLQADISKYAADYIDPTDNIG